MVETIAIIAIYDFHARAKDAMKRLRTSSFDMRQLSIVGLDRPGVQWGIVDYNSGWRTRSCAERDAFWAEVRGQLITSASFGIPSVGLVLVAGPLVAWIAGALDGAAVIRGMSAVGAGLYRFRIPKNSILCMETALKADKLLLVAHGAASEMVRAREILMYAGAVEVITHNYRNFATSLAA